VFSWWLWKLLVLKGDGNNSDSQRLQPKKQQSNRKILKLTMVEASKLLPFAKNDYF
jgi:hypothetical protein